MTSGYKHPQFGPLAIATIIQAGTQNERIDPAQKNAPTRFDQISHSLFAGGLYCLYSKTYNLDIKANVISESVWTHAIYKYLLQMEDRA